MEPVRNFFSLMAAIERKNTLSAKSYIGGALAVLRELRDNGPIRRPEFRSRLKNHGVDAKKLEDLLKRFKLAKPDPGKNGRWKLID